MSWYTIWLLLTSGIAIWSGRVGVAGWKGGGINSGKSGGSNLPIKNLTVGLILPPTAFGVRKYNSTIINAINNLSKSRGPKLKFLKDYQFTPSQVNSKMMSLTPSPTGNFLYKFMY